MSNWRKGGSAFVQYWLQEKNGKSRIIFNQEKWAKNPVIYDAWHYDDKLKYEAEGSLKCQIVAGLLNVSK